MLLIISFVQKKKTRDATTCTHEPQIPDHETLISNRAFRILLERTIENTGISSREERISKVSG